MNKHLHLLSLLWLSIAHGIHDRLHAMTKISPSLLQNPNRPSKGNGPHLPPLPTHGTRPNGRYLLPVTGLFLRRQRRRRIWRPEWRHPKAGLSQPTRRESLWLSPIHPCMSYHGYDVTDYTKVNPQLGTESDFDRLVTEAHNRGINDLTGTT